MDISTAQVGRQQELTNRFNEVRQLTLEICEPLQPEDFVVQPVVDVSPPKWHLAHTTWFFEIFILKKYVSDYRLFDDDYPFLFNSYYENEGDRWIRSERGVLSRPWVKEIMAYRSYVDDSMLQFLKTTELNEEQLNVFEIGLNHEQQHQELMVYDIKHILGINPLFPTYKRSNLPDYQPNLKTNWLRVDEGVYEVGYEGKGFHFDNEEGKHKVYLPGFQVQDRLVTNGEFLEFVEDGGYGNFNHWLMEGHEWVKKENIRAPFYWIKEEGEWFYFTLGGKEKLNLDEPVTHISFYEADAFAKWKGMRLPTEFEWEVACKLHSPEIPAEANFMDSRNFRTMPRVGANPQFYGDAWEWTNSAYLPYPHYQKVDGALGEYNGKFMINQMVLRGGSFATMANHIRPTYRNFFHPHLRWQFTGFRLAEFT
ncbi:MAG: ergothioneine biosynthesis protein EgtB [Roseivirga sp.]|uniref:ergothioneine biosynthesis protein EgtB n=1 Tax=Roseivirga sp. TaxID=1964215 RepID=UPI001B15F924|nr:ergothioneine biosynthesis protein EgtB [Roseivirga sp.]MBO6662088.1 ergothioneine biosynthesis protein EgtB [Roseivirga sp.]MBO6759686.1 ergothioneine biosynthesis protein EgtB [Roseivirga sp.]MBO6910406.1 ergothioneine biosynthesis protein EgtB [Roseivirga sp.]